MKVGRRDYTFQLGPGWPIFRGRTVKLSGKVPPERLGAAEPSSLHRRWDAGAVHHWCRCLNVALHHCHHWIWPVPLNLSEMCRLKGQESGLVHGVFLLILLANISVSCVQLGWFICKYGCLMFPIGNVTKIDMFNQEFRHKYNDDESKNIIFSVMP